VFTARYALSPCIKQIHFVFKGLRSYLLECYAMSTGEELSTFRKSVVPSFSRSTNPRQVVDTGLLGLENKGTTFFRNVDGYLPNDLLCGRSTLNLIWYFEESCCTQLQDHIKYNHLSNTCREAVPWLRRLAGCLLLRRPGFDPGSVLVRFVVYKVTLGQVFLRALRFSPVNFIPPMLHY
jgi:hypothetical protein